MRKTIFITTMIAMAITTMWAHPIYPTKAIAQKDKGGFRHSERLVKQQSPVQFKATAMDEEIPENMALVTLSAGDVWYDGSGYQMLLDADATAYGTLIPESGSLTENGSDADAAVYEAFEYKIPENADGSRSTTNIVVNNSVSILIPAGVYDYVITNPSPGDRIWVASNKGNIPGRNDDFTFEGGKSYSFTVSRSEEGNDLVDLVVTNGANADPTTPTGLTATPKATSAYVEWNDYDDMRWNLHYRVYNPDASANAVAYFWDFEDGMGEWTAIDDDEDNYNWHLYDPTSMGYSSGDGVIMYGTKCMSSESYNNAASAVLYPDNWLISPKVTLDGTLTFWAAGQSADWAAEVFAVYATTGDPSDLASYTMISDGDITATNPIKQYTIDLSSFAGQEGYVAFRHYNVSDMFRLNIDNVSIGTAAPPAPWVGVYNLTDKNYTIENLASNTTYEVQVQATNANTQSDWTESTVFTTLDEQAITEVYVNGYESPVDGEDSQQHLNITVPEDANYHIYANTYSPEWWDNDDDDDFFGTFVGGTRYSVGMTLEANDGYYFAPNCVFYVNGSQELVDNTYSAVDDSDETYAYLWTVPEVATGGSAQSNIITEVYVNGYESPIAGQNSKEHLNLTVPENANYHIYTNTYSPEWWDNDDDDDFFGTFVEGNYYSVGMTIEANEGYTFAENCKFYVNGVETIVDLDYTGVDEEDNTYAYVWTIPEAATPDYAIHEVRVYGYESPVIGKNSKDLLNITVPEDANYHIFADTYSPEWWDNDDDDDFFGTFVEGTYYSVGMTIEANEGYHFAEDCKFYVNDEQDIVDFDYTAVDEENNTYAYVWTIPELAQTLIDAIDNVNSYKTVAKVRYYNLAGQEMARPSGMTIVVTTYTDGTSSAKKVIK